ncbi:hypothetical protein [Neobacillus drentensis]|uniref:hypothetical protein n=1 Tax=Neobacillus drentensis TaxID=220684 RepID=UPI002FFEE007
MYTDNVVQIVEHNSIDEANIWFKSNHEKKIMFVQCHFHGETTGLLGQTWYKVTITYMQ